MHLADDGSGSIAVVGVLFRHSSPGKGGAPIHTTTTTPPLTCLFHPRSPTNEKHVFPLGQALS